MRSPPPDLEPELVHDVLHVAAPLADFVVFVDDGPASADEQARLAAAWPALVDALAGLGADAQVAVLDSSGVVATTADLAGADFAVGSDGPADGQALDALVATFESGALDAFLRPGAALHTVVVSGRDDASAVDFAAWYADLVVTGEAPTFSAVALPGSVYEDLVTDTALIDVRSDPWPLEELAPQAAAKNRRVSLSALPVVPTIEVQVELVSGAVLQPDWVYDTSPNRVRFLDYIPPAGSVVTATYVADGR